MYDVIIVGAGASGLMSAVVCARNGLKTLIIEHKDDIGKKILATGNGKCNFTNSDMTTKKFRGNSKLAENILGRFDAGAAIDFFSELGIMPYSKNGYYYPNSKQASSVVSCFRMELSRLKVHINTGENVIDIQKDDANFSVKTDKSKYFSQNVIISSGLLAAKKLGSDGSIIPTLKKIGHKFTNIVPALCGFYCDGLRFNKVAGIRCDANVSVYLGEQLLSSDSGELQLTDYGISGIVTFQVSRFISIELYKKNSPRVVIDFLPRLDEEEFYSYLCDRITNLKDNRSINEFLCGILPSKLTLELIHKANISPDAKPKNLSSEEIHALIATIKRCEILPKKPRDFEFAQVCAGGVESSQININTLESKLVPGLYFSGEILDVDGMCGGYNLQWAWSSGYVAGMEVSK